MKITKEFLKEHNACSPGYKWFCDQDETELLPLLHKLIGEKHFKWANWLIARCMSYSQRIKYIVYIAEKVLNIFEKEYPDNLAPREAIKAAKECIKNPSEKNRQIAKDAVDNTRIDINHATSVAAYYAADATVYAAYAAAINAATDAAYTDAKKTMYRDILNYGISLLEGE